MEICGKKNRLNGSLRSRVAAVLAIAACILAVVVFSSFQLNRQVSREMMRRYQQEQLIAVSQQSTRLRDTFGYIKNDLSLVGKQIRPGDYVESDVRRQLMDFYSRHSDFVVAGYFMNQDGVLEIVEGKDCSGEGYDISEQAHIKRMLETRKPVVSGSFKAVEGYFAVAVHSPILEDGKVRGSTATLVKWNAFGDWFKMAMSSPGGFMMLLDPERKIIYHPNAEYSGKTLEEAPAITCENKAVPDDFFFRQKTALVNGPFFENEKFVLACYPFVVGNKAYSLASCAPYAAIISPLTKFAVLIGLLAGVSFFVVVLSFSYIVHLFRVERRENLAFQRKLEEKIEERRKMEAALQESEIRYRRFFEEDLSGAFITRPDGRIVACNPAFARMFGYDSPSDLEDIHLKSIYPGDSQREDFLSLLKQKRKLERYETKMRRKDGTIIHTVENTVGVFDDRGELVEIRGYMMDDTERKQLARRLQQAQKMEAIGTLAGGIAHDFNNILNSIMGYCDLSIMDTEKDSNQHVFLQEIHLAAVRAKELVKQILTFARKTDAKREPVLVKAIVKESLVFLRSSLPSTIAIESEIKSDAYTLADPIQIHQIVMNLCTNAGHAMRENGGRLTVCLEETWLDEDQTLRNPNAAPGPFLRLTVADTGHGFSSETAQRIFDPYFTTKKAGEGTGMGLSVVQGIVHSCGGVVAAESEPGRGATFDVYLPVIKTGSRHPESQKPGKAPCNGTENILFVDDEKSLSRMGKMMLERLGYKVTAHTNSLDALEEFSSRPDSFDLVVTDMTMPDLTGEQLAGEIKKIRPDLPVVIVTGYNDRITPEKSISLGIRGMLMKPFDKTELSKMIRGLLDGDVDVEDR